MNAYYFCEIVNTSYTTIINALQTIAESPPYPTLAQFVVQFPTTHAEIVAAFEEYIKALPRTEGKKVLAVIDSIHSTPGVLMPWKDLVKICKRFGILSIVDASHSVGQEPGINLSQVEPDFWVSVGILCNRKRDVR